MFLRFLRWFLRWPPYILNYTNTMNLPVGAQAVSETARKQDCEKSREQRRTQMPRRHAILVSVFFRPIAKRSQRPQWAALSILVQAPRAPS